MNAPHFDNPCEERNLAADVAVLLPDRPLTVPIGQIGACRPLRGAIPVVRRRAPHPRPAAAATFYRGGTRPSTPDSPRPGAQESFVPRRATEQGAQRRLLTTAIFMTLLVHAVITWFFWQGWQPAIPVAPLPPLEITLLSPPPPRLAPPPRVNPAPPPGPVVAPLPRAVIPPATSISPPRTSPPLAPSPPEEPPVATPALPTSVAPLPEAPPSPLENTPSSPPAAVLPTPAPVVPRAETPPTPPGFEAAYLRNPKPPYPARARRLGLQGTVVLRVEVDAQGRPARVEVARSSGTPLLDDAAVQAVSDWTFTPARRGDAAVSGVVEVPVRFSLN